MSKFNPGGMNDERLEITINPDTLEYQMEVHMIRVSHLKMVLEDILDRINSGQLEEDPSVKTYDIDSEIDPLS